MWLMRRNIWVTELELYDIDDITVEADLIIKFLDMTGSKLKTIEMQGCRGDFKNDFPNDVNELWQRVDEVGFY